VVVLSPLNPSDILSGKEMGSNYFDFICQQKQKPTATNQANHLLKNQQEPLFKSHSHVTSRFRVMSCANCRKDLLQGGESNEDLEHFILPVDLGRESDEDAHAHGYFGHKENKVTISYAIATIFEANLKLCKVIDSLFHNNNQGINNSTGRDIVM